MNLSSGDRPVCLPGPDDERAVGGDEALAAADGVLVELGGREVGAHGPAKCRDASRGVRSWPCWATPVQALSVGSTGRA